MRLETGKKEEEKISFCSFVSYAHTSTVHCLLSYGKKNELDSEHHCRYVLTVAGKREGFRN